MDNGYLDIFCNHIYSYLIFKLSDLQECILYGWVVVVDIRGIEIL